MEMTKKQGQQYSYQTKQTLKHLIGYNKRQRRELYNNKGINTEEATTLINIYAPNTEASKYIK